MAIEKCKELCSYEDGSNVVKLLNVGMGAKFNKPYFVVIFVEGIPDIYFFQIHYKAMKFYDKVCFMIDQRMHKELINLVTSLGDYNR